MKKIIALLLASVMLLSLIACGDEKPPVDGVDGDTGADTNGGVPGGDVQDTGADETEAPETEEPTVEDYVPDMDALYGGMVGIGVESGEAWFDNIRVVSKQKGKLELLSYDMEDGAVPAFTYANGSAECTSDVDPIALEGEEPDKVIKATGAMAYAGDTEWNYYQYSARFLPAEGAVVNFYYAITDENNYFMTSLGEDGNKYAVCYQVKDGEKTELDRFYIAMPLDTWSTVGVGLMRETIEIYINGDQYFALFDEEFDIDGAEKIVGKKVGAEYFDESFGAVKAEPCGEGGQNLGYVTAGDWVLYSGFDFGEGVSKVLMRLAGQELRTLELRIDSLEGPVLASFLADTGAWGVYADYEAEITEAVTGVHDLYIYFVDGPSNVNWFIFE